MNTVARLRAVLDRITCYLVVAAIYAHGTVTYAIATIRTHRNRHRP